MSLRLRVVILIGVVLLTGVLLGAIVAGVQARMVLQAELTAALSGAEQTVASAFEGLPTSEHQERDLNQLVKTFDCNRHVKASLISSNGRPLLTSKCKSSHTNAPPWFQHLLGEPPEAVVVGVPEGVRGVFAIVLTPIAEIDTSDAWLEFSRVAIVLIGSAAVGLLLVYLVIGAAFRPLTALSAEFARIGTGDYSVKVQEGGPTEILNLQQGFNKMTEQLRGATSRNRQLTNQLATIQEEERADIARDLHDEIGPHLFGVNVDAEMILQLHEAGRANAIPDQVRSIQTAVGRMQQQVKDLLGRLRPVRETEFGLGGAVGDLAAFWGSRRPEMAFKITLPECEEGVPEIVKEAAYRIVQEATNNSVRHGNPKTIEICVEIQNTSDLVVTVFDDGFEASERQKVGGAGLAGMRERVHALGGSVVFGKTAGAAAGWSVVARLPIDHFTSSVDNIESAA